MKIRLAFVHPSAPIWGQPLFIDGSGRPVYSGRGADVADDGDDEDDAEGDSGTDDADGDTDDDDEGKAGKEKPGAEADAEALRKKMRLADKRAAEAEKRLRELEDKDKDALEVATRKVDELTKVNTELTAKLRSQALNNAFLMVNEYTWEDAEDALDLAQRKGFLEDVQDEDGEVDQAKLKAKLKAFAKAKPHMLKGKQADDDTPAGGPTGATPGSARKKPMKAADEAALRARYSALRK